MTHADSGTEGEGECTRRHYYDPHTFMQLLPACRTCLKPEWMHNITHVTTININPLTQWQNQINTKNCHFGWTLTLLTVPEQQTFSHISCNDYHDIFCPPFQTNIFSISAYWFETVGVSCETSYRTDWRHNLPWLNSLAWYELQQNTGKTFAVVVCLKYGCGALTYSACQRLVIWKNQQMLTVYV